jgi:hypothetical protein
MGKKAMSWRRDWLMAWDLIGAAAANASGIKPPRWWLSFADVSRPEGQQFLGVAIVEAQTMGEATMKTHRLGINPGGQIMGSQLPESFHVPPEKTDRLLGRDEAQVLAVLAGGKQR